MSQVIQNLGKPTLILAHNKILAAQLYTEMKEFFPENAVEYFISYYDYYQPESYIPTTDTYIEKEATINEEIEKMRLRTFASLLSRKDVIVIASISCIYGAGNPQDYKDMSFEIKLTKEYKRSKFLAKLIEMLYERNDNSLESGKFRVRGETIDIFPPYEKYAIRCQFFGDELEQITKIDPLTTETIQKLPSYIIFPAKQYVVPTEKHKAAIEAIKAELEERVKELGILEAERLKRKVKYDLEMIEELGYCSGIENYSRHFDQRKEGQPPFVLLDYFPKNDFLLIIDESHQTLPQSRAMYHGDLSRKKNLVEFGFRLPCAYDNRPLKFQEFEKYFTQTLFVSATPSEYELTHSSQVVEQIIRPTGLLDPTITVKPAKTQVQDVLIEINNTVLNEGRVLITTLTKKMAEDLTEFLAKKGVKVRYMHSEIESLDRIEIIRQLRAKEFDVLIGINLLREGLDIPEVQLVAILDADKEGFLRDQRSLIQTIGRAARNAQGRVIMYGDNLTLSMKNAIEITQKRREAQIKYNTEHNIQPQTIIKKIDEKKREVKGNKHIAKEDLQNELIELESLMKKAAENLDFETAITLRDKLESLKNEL
jgi:excinuclease ABC subunit B